MKLTETRSQFPGILQSLEIAYRRVGRLDEAAACLQRVVALRRELRQCGRAGAGAQQPWDSITTSTAIINRH